MTDNAVVAPTAVDARRTWVIGGSLLIASMVIGAALQPGSLPYVTGGALASVLSASALVLFAVGIRGAGSITARRPLGTSALIALAAWSLVSPFLSDALLTKNTSTGEALLYGTADTLLQLVLALVAVVQIARAGTVPRPWNWAPAWVLAAMAVLWVVEQLVLGSVTADGTAAAFAVVSFDGVVRLGGTVFLGVLAIVLAARLWPPAPAEA